MTMANRFTDSGKWSDPWFRRLPVKYKAFWLYILDNCDHAGIWKVDFELAEFSIKETFPEEETISVFADRIKVINSKWFIKKFVLFQQKVDSLDSLNPNNICHLSIMKILQSEGIISPFEAPSEGLGRGQGIVKVRYSKVNNGGNNKFKKPNVKEVSTYCKDRGGKIDPEAFIDFYEAKNWMIGKNKMKDWRAAVRTWEKRSDADAKAKPVNNRGRKEYKHFDE